MVQAVVEPILLQGLAVYCDKYNLAFIEMLNKTARAYHLKWLKFRRSVQMEIIFRVNFKQ